MLRVKLSTISLVGKRQDGSLVDYELKVIPIGSFDIPQAWSLTLREINSDWTLGPSLTIKPKDLDSLQKALLDVLGNS